MPQFHLDTGGAVTQSWRWGDLDAFTQGYVEALFFTDSGPEDGQLGDAGFADLAPEALQTIITDCARFQADPNVEPLLAIAYEREDYDDAAAGRDFWYTSGGHGVGFWDREQLEAGNLGKALAAQCGWQTPYGERWTSLDCNGKVHLS